MRAIAQQRDGRAAEYMWMWRPLRKFRNSIAYRKFWLTPAAPVPCSNATNIAERARPGRKVNFAPGKIPSGGRAPEDYKLI